MNNALQDFFRLYVDAVLAAHAAATTVFLRTLRLQSEFVKTGAIDPVAWNAMAAEKASAFAKGAVRGGAAFAAAARSGPKTVLKKSPSIAHAAMKPAMDRARANARRLSTTKKRRSRRRAV